MSSTPVNTKSFYDGGDFYQPGKLSKFVIDLNNKNLAGKVASRVLFPLPVIEKTITLARNFFLVGPANMTVSIFFVPKRIYNKLRGNEITEKNFGFFKGLGIMLRSVGQAPLLFVVMGQHIINPNWLNNKNLQPNMDQIASIPSSPAKNTTQSLVKETTTVNNQQTTSNNFEAYLQTQINSAKSLIEKIRMKNPNIDLEDNVNFEGKQVGELQGVVARLERILLNTQVTNPAIDNFITNHLKNNNNLATNLERAQYLVSSIKKINANVKLNGKDNFTGKNSKAMQGVIRNLVKIYLELT